MLRAIIRLLDFKHTMYPIREAMWAYDIENINKGSRVGDMTGPYTIVITPGKVVCVQNLFRHFPLLFCQFERQRTFSDTIRLGSNVFLPSIFQHVTDGCILMMKSLTQSLLSSRLNLFPAAVSVPASFLLASRL